MTWKKDIEHAVTRSADTLRGVVDAANYIDYVLPLVFLKYLGDSHAAADYCSFQSLYDRRFDDNIGAIINAAMRHAEVDSPHHLLAGALSAADYNSESALGNRKRRNAVLRDLLEDIAPLNLNPSMIEEGEGRNPADVIGDAFEYMISLFADMAGKKAGAFHTPAEMCGLMARIANARPGESVYDPACGSGSLLVRAAENLDRKDASVYGQDVSRSAAAMAKMNLYIHGIYDAKIGWGDTLSDPVFLDFSGALRRFDVIVADMPFSLDGWASGFSSGGGSSGKRMREFRMASYLDKFHRFDRGVPPAGKGDWAFLLHMIASLAPNGRIAAAPQGVLYRGASESRIRGCVVEENLLDAVIGLPDNLLYGTSLPACILVFRKNRPDDGVLFIDASRDGLDRQIDSVMDVYRSRVERPGFSYIADIEEIRRNDYNLNIPQYVDAPVERETVDTAAVQSDIARLKREIAAAEAEMDAYLEEFCLSKDRKRT